MNIGVIILIVFLTCWLVVTVYELRNIHSFNLKFLDIGVTILRKEINPRFINWKGFDGIYEEKEGKFVFLPDLKIGYFVTIFRFYRRYGLIGGSYNIFPLTIFGSFAEIEGRLIIKYKVSYRLAFLVGFICILWFCIPILTMNFSSIIASIIGTALTCLITYLAYVFKKMKMKLLTDELKNLLNVKE